VFAAMSRKKRIHPDQQFDEQQAASDLRAVMGTVPGRRLLWRLLARCRIYQSTFTGSSETFFLEGKRSVGLEVLADIHRHCPDLYLLAQQEVFRELAHQRELQAKRAGSAQK
jgi:hypothetical protein